MTHEGRRHISLKTLRNLRRNMKPNWKPKIQIEVKKISPPQRLDLSNQTRRVLKQEKNTRTEGLHSSNLLSGGYVTGRGAREPRTPSINPKAKQADYIRISVSTDITVTRFILESPLAPQCRKPSCRQTQTQALNSTLSPSHPDLKAEIPEP